MRCIRNNKCHISPWRIKRNHSPYGQFLAGSHADRWERMERIDFVGSSEGEIGENLRRLCDSELQDVANVREEMSRADRLALEVIQDNIQYENGRFVVPIPWKERLPELPANKLLVMRGLEYVKKRLVKDAPLKKVYVKAVRRIVEIGYIKRIKSERATGKRIWYLPHHSVLNSKKQKRVRVVFDCATYCG